jgi:hypothetical protein
MRQPFGRKQTAPNFGIKKLLQLIYMFVEFDYFSHYLCRELDTYFRWKKEDLIYYLPMPYTTMASELPILHANLDAVSNDIKIKQYLLNPVARLGDYSKYLEYLATGRVEMSVRVEWQENYYLIYSRHKWASQGRYGF